MSALLVYFKILDKTSNNVYVIDLQKEIGISPTSNAEDLKEYKDPHFNPSNLLYVPFDVSPPLPIVPSISANHINKNTRQ